MYIGSTKIHEVWCDANWKSQQIFVVYVPGNANTTIGKYHLNWKKSVFISEFVRAENEIWIQHNFRPGTES